MEISWNSKWSFKVGEMRERTGLWFWWFISVFVLFIMLWVFGPVLMNEKELQRRFCCVSRYSLFACVGGRWIPCCAIVLETIHRCGDKISCICYCGRSIILDWCLHSGNCEIFAVTGREAALGTWSLLPIHTPFAPDEIVREGRNIQHHYGTKTISFCFFSLELQYNLATYRTIQLAFEIATLRFASLRIPFLALLSNWVHYISS